MRFGEAAALRVTDLALPKVNVVKGIAEVEGRLVESSNKKWERRTLHVPAFLVPELKALTAGKKSKDYVFTMPEGGPLRINTWRRRYWNPAKEKAQATDPAMPTEHLTPHALRHTAASLAVSAGANVKGLQRMLGHRSASVTLDTYADLFDSDLIEVAAALNTARSATLPTVSEELVTTV